MAIVVESYNTATTSGAGTRSVQVTKPTGLAVGDLLLSWVVAKRTGAAATLTGPGDWTDVGGTGYNNGGQNEGIHCESHYKIAESADVSATDFGFTATASVGTTTLTAAVLRISGISSVAPINNSAFGYEDDGGTTFTGTGMTPSVTDCLFLMFGGSSGATFSNYAIATDNPSWTEIFDSGAIAAAYGLRSQATASGNFSFDIATGDSNVGGLIAIKSAIGVTVTPSVIAVSAAAQAPTTQTGLTVSPSVISISSSVIDPSVSEEIEWSTQSKSSTTWTNLDKS